MDANVRAININIQRAKIAAEISILYGPEEIAGRLTVYPTVVVGNEEVSVYFERSIITRCSDILQATATVVMIYYVFDVQYPAELANTCNFLDCSIGRLDQKMKIRPAVQRKLNLLLAA